MIEKDIYLLPDELIGDEPDEAAEAASASEDGEEELADAEQLADGGDGTTSDAEKNGTTSGAEKNGTTSGAEENGTTSGAEENGTTSDAEKNGTTSGAEKNGTTSDAEKNGHPDHIAAVGALRRSLWEAGFRPIAVYNHDHRCKSPGKQPVGDDWQIEAARNPPRDAVVRPRRNALNTGIACAGLRPIDIDIDDAGLAMDVRRTAEQMLGTGPVKTRSNSPKVTILYRAAEGAPRKLVLTGEVHSKENAVKVEVLGAGGQMVAFGTHASGAAIEWESDRKPGLEVALDDLTPVTEVRIAEFLAAVEPVIGAKPPVGRRGAPALAQESGSVSGPHGRMAVDIRDVEAALDAVPNGGPADWGWWKRVMMATWASTGGSSEGFATFSAWSAKNTAHDDRTTKAEWEAITRSPPSRIGFGTLVHLASEARPGWSAPSRSEPESERTSPDGHFKDAVVGGADGRAEGEEGDGVGTEQPYPGTEGPSRVTTMPRGFALTERGLFFTGPPDAKTQEEPEPVRVAAPFEVVGRCRDAASTGWGKVLRWTDPGGIDHEVIVPQRILPSRDGGSAVASMLEDNGLECSMATPLLRAFLIGVRPPRVLRTVETTGWHYAGEAGWVYALPTGEVYGPEGHNVILRPDLRRVGEEAAQAGTLEDWRHQIARYAVGNFRLALLTSAAFAGPLLDLNAEPSGGVHIVGKSRSGKSSGLYMAGSSWGKGTRKVSQWRATANGLEGLAKASSDGVLILDEIGQADGRDAGDSIYMLANGMGKQRASVAGAARDRAVWRVLYLSSGEVGLESKMGEANRVAATGLHVRLVNIDADAGAGMGVFQQLHDKGSAAELADHLREASARVYGVAARVFLKSIARMRADDENEVKELIESYRRQFAEAHVPAGSDGQVLSVAGRFSLIAAAGELATALGVLPWPEGEAVRASGECFGAWLAGRGHSGAGEDEAAIRHLRRFIMANGNARFSFLSGADDMLRERVGWKKEASWGDEYLFQKDQWDSEVFRGTSIDPKRALQALDQRGLLVEKHEGRLTARVSVAGVKVRVVWVSAAVLEE